LAILPNVDPSASSGRGCFLDRASAGICHNQCWHCADDAGCLACRYSSSGCVIFVPDRANRFASFFGVRSGRWGDADVSVREERKRFYPIAIPLSALGTIVMWLANAPRSILRGGMITLLLLIAAAIMNHWSKVSLHTLFATYCTVILFRVNIFCGSAALILAGLVFWSRLLLSRHTISENSSGVALGSVGGIATAWVSI